MAAPFHWLGNVKSGAEAAARVRICRHDRSPSMDAVQQAESGHPGGPPGMADIATVLYKDFMQFDAADPYWFDRGRFLLSNGHGSMLLYSLLYLTGVKDMTLEQLRRSRQIESKTAGHPEYKHADGIETTTGPQAAVAHENVGPRQFRVTLIAKAIGAAATTPMNP
jgi:transketolase